jgi:hypothetical protein
MSLKIVSSAGGEKARLAKRGRLVELEDSVTMPFYVDGSRPFGQIVRRGHAEIHEDITQENFPLRLGRGHFKRQARIFHCPEGPMLLQEVLQEVAGISQAEGRDLRPFGLQELHAFTHSYPEKATKYPIVAPGAVAVVEGERRVVFIARPKMIPLRSRRLFSWLYTEEMRRVSFDDCPDFDREVVWEDQSPDSQEGLFERLHGSRQWYLGLGHLNRPWKPGVRFAFYSEE